MRRTVLYGAIVGLLIAAASPVVYVATTRGIDAIQADNPAELIVSWGVALVAAIVAVVALALYMHWLGTTGREDEPHEIHIPTRSEDWLLGIGTTVAVAAAVPIVWFCYNAWLGSLSEGDLAFAVGYAVIAFVYVAFAVFCVERYVQWMR
ncbi:MAG: hypothetical protein ACRDXB_21150 [Actinomycetes bacterium]